MPWQWPARPCANRACRSPSSTVRPQAALLVDHRDDLVAERTRIQSRLRWHLHELPRVGHPTQSPAAHHILDQVQRRLEGSEGVVASIARELVARSRELTIRANGLEKARTALVKRLAPSLVAMPGCGRCRRPKS